jgi:hypothetical protein
MRLFCVAASIAISVLPTAGQTIRSAAAAQPPPSVRLGLWRPQEIALPPLSEGERTALRRPDRRYRVGIHRSLPERALEAGAWEPVSGIRVWRLAVRSPESKGIRLEIGGFDAGGGRLWVTAGDEIAGPYTGRGPFGDGHFWTSTIASEAVTLEYEPAAGGEAAEAPPFQVLQISHQTLDVVMPVPEAGAKDPADICHLDPNCYPEWADTMKMVAQLVFEKPDGRYVCSGALVNTREKSRRPYFLTAGHCINDEASARSVEVYWTYQTAKCGALPPSSRSDSLKSTQGANLIAWSTIPEGDYSLLLLKDVPGTALFADWDMGDPAMGSALTGIHHPAGSYKRISFGKRIGDTTVQVEGAVAPAALYLELLWEKGRVEHGSSGSPLFSSPGVIVGYLSYGQVRSDGNVCQVEPSLAGYGRLSNAYGQLKDYFENLPAAAVLPDGSEARFAVVNGAAPASKTLRLTTKSAGEVRYKLRADANWIVLSGATGTTSSAAPASLAITVDPSKFDRPGTYQSTVTIFSGAADPQFINVVADVKVDRSNVVATVTPGMAAYTFKLKLEEKNGMATKLTAVKLDGRDFSSSIAGWFGTATIPARGALEADLRTDYPYGGGEHVFEFWGSDEASGRKWYTTANVTF